MILHIIKKIYALGEATEGNLFASLHFSFEEAGCCIDTFYHCCDVGQGLARIMHRQTFF